MSRYSTRGSSQGRHSTTNPITHETSSYLVENARAAGYGSNSYSHSSAKGISSHHYDYADEDKYGHHSSRSQVQAQDHMFRSAQASKQMVYEVFGNTIAMMEEMEARELAKQSRATHLQRSDIHLHSQTEHDDSTIQRKLDTQLLLMQSQLESCDREIRDGVKDELKAKTLDWCSQRQANALKRSKTDKYAAKLFEVLEKGKTKHPDEFYKTPTISERDMQRSMGAYMKGSHRRSELDTSFRDNPGRQAAAPRIRAGAGRDLGAERLIEERPDLKSALGHYKSPSLR